MSFTEISLVWCLSSFQILSLAEKDVCVRVCVCASACVCGGCVRTVVGRARGCVPSPKAHGSFLGSDQTGPGPSRFKYGPECRVLICMDPWKQVGPPQGHLYVCARDPGHIGVHMK